MKKYFVIGNPINHSLSPELHNYWIKQKNISGVNVTVPFKNAVIPYLDELSDEAKKTHSVNIIYLKNNKLVGHNTDIIGFETAIKKINFNFNNKKIFILGAGGVVPSIVYASIRMGSSVIFVSNRTKSKAERIKNIFDKIQIVNWGDVPNFDVIINATSLGLNKDDKINIQFNKIEKNKLFYDVIYNPRETNFLSIGKKSGNTTENGKLMFIYQAFSSFKLWHGIEPFIDDEIIELLDR